MSSSNNILRMINSIGSSSGPPSGPQPWTTRSYIWYGSLFILILALIIVFFVIGLPYFTTKSPPPNLLPLPDRQVDFTTFPVHSDLSANFVELQSDNYTVSADIYLTGAFESSTIPRILLYRSHTPVHLGITDLSGIKLTPFPLLKLFPATNLVVWMDHVTNDIYVSAITQEIPDGDPTEIRSAPLSNVPIQSTFRISIVFTQHFMEIYKDGALEQTIPFVNPPMPIHSSSYFFPPVLPLSKSVYLANVSIYNTILTSRQIQQESYATEPDSFFQ